MKLTKKDKELIKKAKSLVDKKKVTGGIIREVGSALETKNGEIFTGASVDLYCGVGFCAEHTAVGNMASHSKETQIKNIVAFGQNKIMNPCGRCRELMQLIDKRNRDNTNVIISNSKKIKLKALLPNSWM